MQMQRWVSVSAGLLMVGFGAPSLFAQTANQTVTFSVVAVSRVAISGSMSPMTVSTATAGQAPTSASVGGTSYAITTNETNQKISASLSQAMPTGISLAVSLGAPAGAASTGSALLGTAATDVVTGISTVSASSLPIVYTLQAAANSPITSGTRVVTYTITGGQ